MKTSKVRRVQIRQRLQDEKEVRKKRRRSKREALERQGRREVAEFNAKMRAWDAKVRKGKQSIPSSSFGSIESIPPSPHFSARLGNMFWNSSDN